MILNQWQFQETYMTQYKPFTISEYEKLPILDDTSHKKHPLTGIYRSNNHVLNVEMYFHISVYTSKGYMVAMM